MNILETGELLARIQVHDNRNFDKLTIEEWQLDLADVSYADAVHVVRDHRRTSTDYITANHVIQGVKRIRAKRLEGVDDIDPPPEVAEGGVQAYLDWRRRLIREVADGTYVPEPARELPQRDMTEVRHLLRRPGEEP